VDDKPALDLLETDMLVDRPAADKSALGMLAEGMPA
jgi:hypothetical protein